MHGGRKGDLVQVAGPTPGVHSDQTGSEHLADSSQTTRIQGQRCRVVRYPADSGKWTDGSNASRSLAGPIVHVLIRDGDAVPAQCQLGNKCTEAQVQAVDCAVCTQYSQIPSGEQG